MTDRITAGVLQANGTKAVEPRMDVRHVAEPSLHGESAMDATYNHDVDG